MMDQIGAWDRGNCSVWGERFWGEAGYWCSMKQLHLSTTQRIWFCKRPLELSLRIVLWSLSLTGCRPWWTALWFLPWATVNSLASLSVYQINHVHVVPFTDQRHYFSFQDKLLSMTSRQSWWREKARFSPSWSRNTGLIHSPPNHNSDDDKIQTCFSASIITQMPNRKDVEAVLSNKTRISSREEQDWNIIFLFSIF